MWRCVINTLQPFVVLWQEISCVFWDPQAITSSLYPVLQEVPAHIAGYLWDHAKWSFSPPKRNSSRREGLLEAGPPVKTCKCHIIAECFDWLWEWVSTWEVLSLLVLLAKTNNGSIILSLAWVWQLVGMAPLTVYIQNIWCLVFCWWQPKLNGSESAECRGKPCLPRIQLTI